MNGQTLGDVADAIGATLDGPAERIVLGMAPLTQAGPEELCYAESDKQLPAVKSSAAAAVIVSEDFPPLPEQALLRVADPRRGFIQSLELFAPDRRLPGIHPSAVIADDVELGEGVGIGPLVVVDSGCAIGDGSQIRAGACLGRDVTIGRDCDIGSNVSIGDGCRVGNCCILHAGVVLGSDGYGYMWWSDHHHKIPQLGRVVVGDDVEMGGNVCIDRATMGETRIGDGCKLDNLVHIAHNCVIGRHALLTGQVGIAGSSDIGDGVVMGGQSGVGDHVSVGKGVQIAAQAGVTSDVAEGSRILGTPGRDMNQALREHALLRRLPDMRQQLREQSRQIAALQAQIDRLEGGLID